MTYYCKNCKASCCTCTGRPCNYVNGLCPSCQIKANEEIKSKNASSSKKDL